VDADAATRQNHSVKPPELISIDPISIEEVDGVRLERARVAHASSLADTVAANLEHLRPWMPWASDQSADVEFQRERLAGVEREWDNDTEYQYLVMSNLSEAGVVGSIGLMTRQGPGTLELGYWLDASTCGRGIATRAAEVLTEWAVAEGSTAMIRCDAANGPSNAVARRLAYRLDRVEHREPQALAETGLEHVWLRP
jgi:RimJ/RimL family protein N-acetyltransferase